MAQNCACALYGAAALPRIALSAVQRLFVDVELLMSNAKKQMSELRDVISNGYVALLPEETLAGALNILSTRNQHFAPIVTAEGRFMGAISFSRLKEIAAFPLAKFDRVSQYMTSSVYCIHPHTPLKVVIHIFHALSLPEIYVVEDNSLKGVILQSDVANKLHATMASS